MIQTLKRAAVIAATLVVAGAALAGTAHADDSVQINDPLLPTFKVGLGPLDVTPCPPYCPEDYPDQDGNPPIFQVNCPPICPESPDFTGPYVFCPPICVEPGDGGGQTPEDEPTDEPTQEPTEPAEAPTHEPTADDGGGVAQQDGATAEPTQEPTVAPTSPVSAQEQTQQSGGPDVALLIASGFGLLAAMGFGYLVATRRR